MNPSGNWLEEILGKKLPGEGGEIEVRGHRIVMHEGIPRVIQANSGAQNQTRQGFGYKWSRRDTFESDVSLGFTRRWLVERYGDIANEPWLKEHGEQPLLMDAGCGAAHSGLELFRGMFDRIRYLGVDISSAIDVAKTRFAERNERGCFLQASLMDLPFAPDTFDLILSEGVLHHTDSTRGAFEKMVEVLKPGGRFMFYVYRRKGPIREFSDDYIREKLQKMDPEQAWEALMPLTRLGEMLGDLGLEVEVPEAIDLLEIPAGKINIQRLFYWHVFKAFYNSDMTLDEENHYNFDWYYPRNAHRQSLQEVRSWCAAANMEIEREVEELAGITIRARKGT